MEMNEIRDRVLQHDLSIQNFDTWAQNAEKRLNELEKSRDLLADVKIALAELKMSNKYFTEKLDELKAALDNINKDNKEQHGALGKRVQDIEGKPGRTWEKLVWLVVAGIIGVVIGYFGNLFR